MLECVIQSVTLYKLWPHAECDPMQMLTLECLKFQTGILCKPPCNGSLVNLCRVSEKISYPIHEGPTFVLFLCKSLVQNFEKLCHSGLLFMFIFTSLCGNNLASRHMIHTCSFNYKHPYIVSINIFLL